MGKLIQVDFKSRIVFNKTEEVAEVPLTPKELEVKRTKECDAFFAKFNTITPSTDFVTEKNKNGPEGYDYAAELNFEITRRASQVTNPILHLELSIKVLEEYLMQNGFFDPEVYSPEQVKVASSLLPIINREMEMLRDLKHNLADQIKISLSDKHKNRLKKDR